MEKKFEATISLLSLLILGAALIAFSTLSGCNQSWSPQPVSCPSWGCGNPPHPPVACPLIAGECNGPIAVTGNTSFSQDSDTKDVDLQRAEIQDQNMNNRAQAIADKFDMNFESAHQLAVLVERVQALDAKGAVSAEDEQGVVQAAIGIAGLSQDEINSAIAQSLQGDESATNSLMEKAAQNLGMSSTATLRDQLLPALGIQ